MGGGDETEDEERTVEKALGGDEGNYLMHFNSYKIIYINLKH